LRENNKMIVNQFQELKKKYNINDIEFICISLNLILNNKVLSYSMTIGKDKRIKSMQQSATNFFKRIDIQKFMFEQNSYLISEVRGDSDNRTEQNSKKQNTLNKKDIFAIPGDTQELTKGNIQRVLESELSKIVKPEQRTALLIRIADLLSLQNSNSNEVEKPVIYLPNQQPEAI